MPCCIVRHLYTTSTCTPLWSCIYVSKRPQMSLTKYNLKPLVLQMGHVFRRMWCYIGILVCILSMITLYVHQKSTWALSYPHSSRSMSVSWLFNKKDCKNLVLIIVFFFFFGFFWLSLWLDLAVYTQNF